MLCIHHSAVAFPCEEVLVDLIIDAQRALIGASIEAALARRRIDDRLDADTLAA